MKNLKMHFILVYLVSLLIASLHSITMVIISAGNISWLGASIATIPSLLFILKLGISKKSTSKSPMTLPIGLALIGSLIAFYGFEITPMLYSVVIGLLGGLLYHFWYSKLNHHNQLDKLVGKNFPNFKIATADSSKPFSNQQLIGCNSLLIFYRGNWCPLCVTQIREIAEQYQMLSELNTQLVFISPQKAQETYKIAKKFSIDAIFAIDDSFVLSDILNITHQSAAPSIFTKGSTDTVFPTVIITDHKGIIRWVDQTDNYRERPEPKQFLPIIKSLSGN